jgi:polyhydroxyalkanoate synthesis regulator phasin
MKRIITIALVVFSLAAVPAAFADDTTAPAAPAAPGQQQSTNDRPNRGGHLGLRLKIAVHRFRKHCGTSADGSPERCAEVAKKAEERLTKLDEKVQARIAKIQETCAATSTDERCKHADERIARLQKLDERIQALAAKVQAWLSGTATSDTSLDQAAADLNQLGGATG